MSGTDPHIEWREQIAAAVVERRPPDRGLADHLAVCAVCTDEWRRLAGASARLITAARTLPLDALPPLRLREEVVRAVATDADRRQARSSPAGLSWRVRVGRWPARLAWGLSGLLVGATVVLVALWGGPVSSNATVIALTGSRLAPAAVGTAALAPLSNGTVRVTLDLRGLPATTTSDFYELWLVGDQGRVSAGTFRSDGSPTHLTFMTAANLARYPRIGITLEPDDGNPAPSDQRVAGSS